ncbi:hypothetical protein ASE67_02485 [Sphingomonas sp. Leaf23]|uniref:hypothetical protein n=1 Tax=Sphingomonas sp. Leaf23 TaxID=1735689 RepID=UPI00070086B5|nr:hypothetical protein [Sphingomonas sp. Leaf23]KQM88627.1 hypothetical protein ASE67_02485 [Sphingomonas sp. Leaf23]
MSAEQMKRDGIKRLHAWSKPRSIGYATVQDHIERPKCGCCHIVASYTTPIGPRCFTHATEYAAKRQADREAAARAAIAKATGAGA